LKELPAGVVLIAVAGELFYFLVEEGFHHQPPRLRSLCSLAWATSKGISLMGRTR